MRALMANRHDFLREMTADDISLVPPIPDAVSFLDWHRHGELFQAAYAWTQDEVADLAAAGTTGLARHPRSRAQTPNRVA